MSEDDFIVGQVKLNGENAPCIEVLLDTASGRGKDDILLLKEIGEETRRAYKDKLVDSEVDTE